MKKSILLAAACGVCAFGQSLDLGAIDKLAAKAKEANTVNLTGAQLRAAARLIPAGDDEDKKDVESIRKVLAGLDSVQVRNFEFENAGDFTDSDLDGVRAQVMKMPGCAPIVDSRSKKEHSQVLLCTENGKTTGIIVIDSEPKELNVVYIKGSSIDVNELGKLDGTMGIPKIDIPKSK